ncbi:MAG: hypothetical protein HZB92_03610 [Euryarchaeota archaeon]|nr:hypothetical protein [Euryarchaeota archaeon]
MSLTSFIKNSDVKERFLHEFPKPLFNQKKELLAPPVTNHYASVGTAFDYLLRFYLEQLNPIAVSKHWVAEAAHELVANNERIGNMTSKIIADAKANRATCLKTGQINDNLLRSAILLAQLDPIFRAGVIDENIGIVDDNDILDLKNLISIVQPNIFKARDLCLLDPTFGMASTLVGGADVDLVLDDMIIDIKTTKNFELQRDYFNQLIGYYTLYRIAGIDGMPPNHDIRRIGIYFSRHGYLHLINVQEVINENSFSEFIEWFKARASMGV